MIRILLAVIVSFALAVIIMPLVIKLSKKLKLRQTILGYVDNHISKNGTPTMGGIGFLLALSVSSLIFGTKENSLMLITLAVTIGYGVIGFLDDFMKVFFKRNMGLSAWQKLTFQLLMAVVVSLFAYYNVHVGDGVYIPFTFDEMHFGIFAVPFYIIIFLAFTNSVNLTDGLDGLAAKVSTVYALFFALFIAITLYVAGGDAPHGNEYTNLLVYCGAFAGALIGFLCYNGYPAKIFMGDTGALALGGGLAALAIVTKLELTAPILGIIYVATSLSVILQVVYFKLSHGKRIFLMAPLHHHFERKGIHENRISMVYGAVTFAAGVAVCLIMLFVNKP